MRTASEGCLGLAVLGACLLVTSLAGQQPPGADTILRPGTAVRVTVDARVPVVGTFAYLRADTLAFQRTGTTVLVRTPLDSVTRLEVRTGTRRHVGSSVAHGALIGGGIGVGIGILGAIVKPGANSGLFDFSAGTWIVGYGSLGLVAGTTIGLLTGLAGAEPVWEPVPLGPLRVGLGVVPGGQDRSPGAMIGISLPLRL